MDAGRERYEVGELERFARALLLAAGAEEEKAAVVAEVLVEGDLMGHDTHGLALMPGYLRELRQGTMASSGTPTVVRDGGPVVVWDGCWLPGPWLTVQAVELACERAAGFGVGIVAVQRSHHIACLEVYLARATARGCLALVTCSDPGGATVAPFGGLDRVFQPDPFASGFPTSGDPILVDTSASITTNGMVGRRRAAGERLGGPWLQDGEGRPSDDPAVLAAEPPGALLLTGGQEYGQKGYAMALLAECLSQGLSGYGRANAEKHWGCATFVQVLDPRGFAGLEAFQTQSDHLAARCRASRPLPGGPPVRLPGERALSRRREALADGVALYPGVLEGLGEDARTYGVSLPAPLCSRDSS